MSILCPSYATASRLSDRTSSSAATVFAYGQTSSGKTFTMYGDELMGTPGIIPLAIQDIFGTIENVRGLPMNQAVCAMPTIVCSHPVHNRIFADSITRISRAGVVHGDLQ